jgi:hypothetical protein
MDLSEFRRRLSTLGPDIHAWPDRDAALGLLAASDEAVALLAAVGADAATPSPEEVDAIVAAVRTKTAP